MTPRTIPDDVLRRQSEASDPAVSAFVSANAGSGKTHVLAERVIRLMLSGCDPQRILCITFTKAAAANMATQVSDRLARWIALDDGALDVEIRRLSGRADGAARVRARRLFTQALETPGGLKVQTIHAFCTRLLQLFPFEANVPARFTVLDERGSAELLDRATFGVLLDAAASPEGRLGKALATAITTAADQTFRDVVREAIGRRDDVLTWVAAAGGVSEATADLSRALGIDPDETADEVEKAIVEGPNFPSACWPELAAAFQAGSKNDKKQAALIAAAMAASGRQRRDYYITIFLTKDFDKRAAIMTTRLAAAHPDLAARLLEEQARVMMLLERIRAIAARDRTAALITIAVEAIARYGGEKSRRGLLDYDDLIDRTLNMLATASPSWVHYKLDEGIDHVLIDEAQDTSEKQWRIVEQIVEEFAAGAGARKKKRTIFAVGDEKQSIFSFQGASPHMFGDMRSQFRQAFDRPELGWRNVSFHHSFRSGANVLHAVDRVFTAEVAASVTSDADGVPPHIALPDCAPGLVEIWELEKPQPRRDIEAWDAPFDEETETSPRVALAQRIARTIRALHDKGTQYREILILVRQRGPLFNAIIDTLKKQGIAVAGADRMQLTAQVAVEDLLALAHAILSPADDLSLAVALKSPVFGFDDDLLFRLAWGREGTLRAALVARSAEDRAFSEAAERLARYEAAARKETPFAFYAWLLGAQEARRAMLARLGPETNDALDEFLDLALDYERRETPTLQGFVAWIASSETDIKRDMELGRDEVRVMTVHGAKGLEARVVFLADTTTKPEGAHQPRLLRIARQHAPPGTPDHLVWAVSAKEDAPAVAQARARARAAEVDEHRRLLYVAMTRAAERLIVCGCEGVKRRPSGCWYDLIADALGPGIEELGDDGLGITRRFRPFEATADAPASSERETTGRVAPPQWLQQGVREAPHDALVITPSSAHAGERTRPRGGAAQEARRLAMERGRIVHRLLQSLPDLPPHRRVEIGRRYVDHANTFAPAERDKLLDEVINLMEEPSLRDLFIAESRAEVPIIGRIERPGRAHVLVSGQIDRFCVTQDSVRIADFKTDRLVSARLAQIPPAYVAQLSLYRAILSKIYPRHVIRAALIFTESLAMVEFASADLDAAFAEVMAGSRAP